MTGQPHPGVSVRADIAAMQPYVPNPPLAVFAAQVGRPVAEIIKLDANENPYGPSPNALAALAAFDHLHVYPDPEMRELRAMLAAHLDVSAEHILVGSGSDELIHLITQVFIAPGDVVLNCPPTFSMYAFHAAQAHANVVNVQRGIDFALDVDAIERVAAKLRPKLLFLCTPNNPDGGLIAPEALERLLALPLVVVLDEAYIPFSGEPSAAVRVPDTSNLIVLQTFSKWAGLAGLRIGYGVFPRAIIRHLWKIKQPYNVNAAADVAARASLADLPALEKTAARIVTERARLAAALEDIAFLSPYPSRANFVLCRVDGVPLAELRAALEAAGILIRYYDGPDLRGHVRISTGTPEQTDALLAVLRQIEEDTS